MTPLSEQVVTLAGTLAHAGEHREAVVAFGDVVDQLLDEYRLAYTGAAEEADFTTLAVRLEEVDHLDAGEEDFGADCQVFELGSGLVDRAGVVAVEFGQVVDGVSDDVEQTPLYLVAGRNRNRLAERIDAGSALEAVGTFHGHAAHGFFSDVLLHFENKLRAVGAVNLQRREDGGKDVILAVEGNVDHGADNLGYFSEIVAHFIRSDL